MRIMRVNVVAPREDISKHVPTIYTAFKKFIKHFPVNCYCMLYIFLKNKTHQNKRVIFQQAIFEYQRVSILYGSTMDCCQAVWVLIIR